MRSPLAVTMWPKVRPGRYTRESCYFHKVRPHSKTLRTVGTHATHERAIDEEKQEKRTEHSHHGDAAVLGFDFTEEFELLLVRVDGHACTRRKHTQVWSMF